MEELKKEDDLRELRVRHFPSREMYKVTEFRDKLRSQGRKKADKAYALTILIKYAYHNLMNKTPSQIDYELRKINKA